MRNAAFVYSERFDELKYPASCPFNISRAPETKKILESMSLLEGENKTVIGAAEAKRMELKKFHTARYLHTLKSASKGRFEAEAFSMGIGTPDCPVFEQMYEYSALACGASLKGADLILSGQAELVFNPSGGLHHSGPEKAAGFCYMNDVALACIILSEAGKKVLYLDVDVHHGDGVQDAFYSRNDVMTISFHQDGRTLFPGTGFVDEIGTEQGKGYSVNVPLPLGTYDEAYIQAFKAVVLPLFGVFEPDVIVFELGADTLAGDPLANLQLTNNTYADIIHYLLGFDRPILMTGGGGYNIQNTARAWAWAWTALCGDDDQDDMNLGLGGVMLESTDWQGGLKDRELPVSSQQRQLVEASIENTLRKIKENIFPIHGI
ncbi:MAG: acetoin utilization protein AcuC [Planctomycetota bacterium]